jgi:hypothetical protein
MVRGLDNILGAEIERQRAQRGEQVGMRAAAACGSQVPEEKKDGEAQLRELRKVAGMVLPKNEAASIMQFPHSGVNLALQRSRADDEQLVTAFLRCLKDIDSVAGLWMAYTAGKVPSTGVALQHTCWKAMEEEYLRSVGVKSEGVVGAAEGGSLAVYRKWRVSEGERLVHNRKDIIQRVERAIAGGLTEEEAIRGVQLEVTIQHGDSLEDFNSHLKEANEKAIIKKEEPG